VSTVKVLLPSRPRDDDKLITIHDELDLAVSRSANDAFAGYWWRQGFIFKLWCYPYPLHWKRGLNDELLVSVKRHVP